MTTQAVFLDRDGVLNEAVVRDGHPYPPTGTAELVVLPGVVGACRRLRDAGFVLVMVTNQPDIARGTISATAVTEVNEMLRVSLGLDDVRMCPHDDVDGCACRKPLPGMLHDAARQWGVDLRRSVMVGDRWRDVEAGRRAGCHTVLIDRSYHEDLPLEPDLVVQELSDAVPWIVALRKTPSRETR